MPIKTPSSARREEDSDTSSTVNSTPQPSHVGNPNDLPQFVQNLCEWLDARDSRYVTLVEYGYVTYRGKSCFASDNHIDRYCNGLISKGSFQKPTKVLSTDFTALPISATISTAARTPSSSSPSGTPDPAATSTASLTPPPQNHVVNEENRAEVDREMGQAILSCMSTKSLRDSWKADHGTSGVALLIGIVTAKDTISSDASSRITTISNRMAARERAGIANASCGAFHEFVTDLDAFRPLLEGTELNVPDANFSVRLLSAAKRLGPFLAQSFAQEVRITKARGNLKKTKDAIITILADHEADEEDKEALDGRALAASRPPGDPRKNTEAAAAAAAAATSTPKGDWADSAQKGCRHCKRLKKPKGKHWNNDCPYLKESVELGKKRAAEWERKQESAKSGKANAARGAHDDDACSAIDDDEDDDAQRDDEQHASVAFVAAGSYGLLDVEDITGDAESLINKLEERGKASQAAAAPTAEAAPSPASDSPVSGRAAMARGNRRQESPVQSSSSPDYSSEEDDDIPNMSSPPPPPLSPPASEPTPSRMPSAIAAAAAPPLWPVPMGTPVGITSFDQLTPVSPVADFKSFRANSSNPAVQRVSVRTGGSDSRRKSDIYSDLFSAVHGTPAPASAPAVETAPPPLAPPPQPMAPPPAPQLAQHAPPPPAPPPPPAQHLPQPPPAPPPPPAQQLPPPPPPPPPPYSAPDSAPRRRFRQSLTTLYFLSPLEDKSPPPSRKLKGKNDALVHRVSGVELARQYTGKHGLYILMMTGSDGSLHSGKIMTWATDRDQHPVQGSHELRAAVLDIRLALAQMLAVTPGDDEDTRALALSRIVSDDFEASRIAATEFRAAHDARQQADADATAATAAARAAVERAPTPGGRFRSIAINSLIVLASIAIMPFALDAIGAPPRTALLIAAPVTVALLPLLLGTLTATLPILIAQTGWGPSRLRRTPPSPPSSRARTTRAKAPGRARPPTSAVVAALPSRRLPSPPAWTLAAAAVLVHPAADGATLSFLVLGLGLLLVAVRSACLLFRSSMVFLTGHPPPPLDLPSRGPRVLPTVCLGVGGVARLIRRLARSALVIAFNSTINILVGTTIVGCLGLTCLADDTHEPDTPIYTYRAPCDFDASINHHLSVLQAKENPHHESSVPKQLFTPSTSGRALSGRGRNLGLSKSTLRALLGRSVQSRRNNRLELVLDSGCTMSCHPVESDLINRRSTNETITGIDGIPKRAKCIGDLPITATDKDGNKRNILIRNVRCVPSFTDTLISIDELFEQTGSEVRFANHRKIYVPTKGGKRVIFPFHQAPDRLYIWDVGLGHNRSTLPKVALVASQPKEFDLTEFHQPRSLSQLTALNSKDLAFHLHHRLHISSGGLARLPSLVSESIGKVAHLAGSPCVHCLVANAANLKHSSSDNYSPSYVGRLTHGDMVGPFKRSAKKGFQYALVLTDDHSRFKTIYFLQNKSEALNKVRSYVASINARASKLAGKPTKVAGHFHMDNAGEFLSREFKDFLDSESLTQSTCPPHVHSLNGVSERAIRSVVENGRAHMISSASPIGFWPEAFEHAVDVLNRTTTPPDSESSCYEHVHGRKPKILPLLPFGCRAVCTLPRSGYSKRNVEAHGIDGINLGLSPTVISSYRIWIPSLGKIMTTSNVYFDPTYMPWRDKDDRRVGPAPLVAADPDSGIHSIEPSPSSIPTPRPPSPSSITESFEQAARGTDAPALRSKKVLVLFSGAYGRPDGLAPFLARQGLEAVLVDNDPNLGDARDDILNDEFYRSLLERARNGEFRAIFCAPPCSTFSVSRFFKSASGNGPPIVRDRKHVSGLPNCPARHRAELINANAMVARMVAIIAVGWKAGSQYIIENPVDRGDRAFPRAFLEPDHAPIWLMPEMIALKKATDARTVDFSQCMFGAPWQKRTTLMYSVGFESWMSPLRRLDCTHLSHNSAVGGARSSRGNWVSAESAAYPPDLNFYLSRALASVVVSPVPAITTAKPAPPKPALDDVEETPDEPSAQPMPAAVPDASSSRHSSVVDPSPRRLDFAADEPVAPTLPSVTSQASTAALRDTSVRDPKIWGHRAANGSPIRLRPRRALMLLGSAALCLSPWVNRANLASGDSSGRAFVATEPKNFKHASTGKDSDGWWTSMKKEFQNHLTNGSWEWVDASSVPKGRRLIKLIWVYKVKRDGSLKSRLCVQGCNQQSGIDYDQTFSAALRSPSLRMLASYAAHNHCRMRRFDFVSAYLQGELEEGEVVYCSAPPGFERVGSDGQPMVCKVIKPIYGMAQAGRRWQR